MSHKRHTFPVKLRRTMFVCAALIAAIGTVASMYLPVANAAPCGSGCVASLSVTPGSGTYNPGNTITVSVYVNSGGQSINAVQADFTYTASRLEFQSINTSGSAFDVNPPSTGGGGSVSIARGSFSGVSGTNLLAAQVSFKVLSDAGTGSISFSSSSEVYTTSNSNILGNKTGANYTISIPTPPPTQPTQQQAPPPQGPTPSLPGNTTKKPAPTSSQPANSTPQATPETATPTTTEDPKTNTTTATDTTKSTPVKKSNAWLTPALIIGGIVVVGAGGAGAWLLLRRRHSIVPITGGSVPTSDFITGPGVAMPPVQPPMTPPQNGENPNSEAGDRSDPFSRP